MTVLLPLALAPRDTHNEQLAANVHPPDWENPKPGGRYNMVVVGAGTAGLVTAVGAVGLGAKVALIERSLLGGDCLNVGCVPSKALIRAARAAAAVRAGGRFGVTVTGEVNVDFPAVMERMRSLRAGISHHDSVKRMTDLGIDVYLGQGRFNGPDTIEVDGASLEFSRACIATGARASAPPIEGLEEAGYLTNETVFSLTVLPRRLAVIGAGPIGCELAQTFARFGSQVTLLESRRQILGREDQDAARIVEAALRRDGVDIKYGVRASAVRRDGADKVVVIEGEGGGGELRVDEILVGVGRAPNVDGLGLETAGVAYDKGGVKVDDRLRTANRKIYAAGDICFPYKFTHTADAMARIVIRNALFRGRGRTGALVIPWCTYTEPEIAHVGLYEREAEERGFPVETFVQEFKDVDRAILDGETEGFVKLHVRKGTGTILGATIVAHNAGDMISEITLAMVGKIKLGALSSTIHPYPTQAEAIKKVGDAFMRTRLTPFVKNLFSAWLAWTR